MGCLIAATSFGTRATYGLFTVPISAGFGWTREVFAFTFAVQNLCWGIGQPLAGPLVNLYGPFRVLAGGGVLFAAGIALMPFSSTPLLIVLTSGVMVGLAMGAASNVTVMAVIGRLVTKEKRSWALGLVTAAASFGQFVLAPTGSTLIDHFGWKAAALTIAGLAMLVPLYAMAFSGISLEKPPMAGATATREAELGETVLAGMKHPSYVLLFTGFFVCGFQLSFITAHLPAYLKDREIGEIAGWTVAAIGLFNIIGSYGAGLLGARRSNKILLCWIYLARSAIITLFITLPPSPAVSIMFGVFAGILWLSTVPLTSALVAMMFGTRHLGTMFGIVFLGHQIGSFFGAWLGGHLYVQTGSYDTIWWITIALGIAAAALHYVIDEKPAPRFEAAA